MSATGPARQGLQGADAPDDLRVRFQLVGRRRMPSEAVGDALDMYVDPDTE